LFSIPAGQSVSIALLKIDPIRDPIRNRPDFQQLLSGREPIGPNKQAGMHLGNVLAELKRRKA
jgi:hypothetical protein